MISPDAPVAPAEFRGREAAIQKVRDQLLHPERLSSAIVGGPSTGKTSLMRYLASSYADEKLPGLKYRASIDAQLLSSAARPADFWKTCCRALLETAEEEPAIAGALKACIDAPDLDLWDLQSAFDTFGQTGTPAVLFIDNWDLVLRNQNYWGDLFHTVRALGQRQPRGVAFVVAAPRPLLEMWIDQMGSIYYNTFANVLIASMTEKDIREQTAALIDSAGLKATPEQAQKIADLAVKASDNHPWLALYVTTLAIEQTRNAGAPDTAAIRAALRDPDGKVAALIRAIRSALTATERSWLDSLQTAPGTLTQPQRDLLRRLRDYGLLPPGTRL